MKKVIILSFAVAFLASCERTVTEPGRTGVFSMADESKLINDLQQLTDEYVRQEGVNQQGTEKLFKWNVLKEDIKGAGVGAAAGGAVGSALPGVGTAAGTIGGAVVGAAVWSCAEAFGKNPPTTQARTNPSGGVITNPNNPYDIVGEIHNRIINNILADFTLVTGSDGLFSVEKCYRYAALNANNIPLINNAAFELYPFNLFMDDYFSIYLVNSSENFFNSTQALLSAGKINQLEKSIMDIYWVSVRAGTRLTAFENFTVAYENIIIASNLNPVVKGKVLSMLAVSRYSQAFWNE